MTKKSQVFGFILALIFGPLGLFYSSAIMAVIYIGIGISAAVFVGDPSIASVAGTIIWFVSIITSFFTVSSHNRKVEMMWMMRR
jgi:hypothetical protein